MNLTELDSLHECASFVYEAGVTVTPVVFPEVSNLWRITNELGKHCDRLKLGSAWEEFRRLNSILYYRLAGGICPPNYVIREMEDDLRNAYKSVKASATGVSTEVRLLLEQFVKPETGLWSKLVEVDSSPFYSLVSSKIEEAVRRNQKSAVFVLRESRFRDQTLKLLMPFQDLMNVAVRRSNELRSHPRVDRVFYVGSIKSLGRLEEEFLLRAPITDEFDLFELSNSGTIQGGSLDIFALEPGRHFLINQAPAVGNADRLVSRNSTRVADEEFEEDQIANQRETILDENAHRSVDAFRAILGGGFGVNLGAGSNVFIAQGRNQGATLFCTRIEKKDVLDLEPGDLIVLTTEGSGDLIASYADRYIGPRAGSYRELQQAWKRDLSDLIRDNGITEVIEMLKSESGFAISASNVRQWLGPTVHGPGKERPLLFDAVLKLTNRIDKIGAHKEALDQIRDASMRAGHYLQSELRRKLVGMNLQLVLSYGYMKFRIDANGPEKTIFEILKLDGTIRAVSPHHINRAFKLKQGHYIP